MVLLACLLQLLLLLRLSRVQEDAKEDRQGSAYLLIVVDILDQNTEVHKQHHTQTLA